MNQDKEIIEINPDIKLNHNLFNHEEIIQLILTFQKQFPSQRTNIEINKMKCCIPRDEILYIFNNEEKELYHSRFYIQEYENFCNESVCDYFQLIYEKILLFPRIGNNKRGIIPPTCKILLTRFKNGQDNKSWCNFFPKFYQQDQYVYIITFGQPRIFEYKDKKTHEIKQIILRNAHLLILSPDFITKYSYRFPQQKEIKLSTFVISIFI